MQHATPPIETPHAAVQVLAYDRMQVCYALLTERILAALPLSSDGVWLQSNPSYGRDVFRQTIELFKGLAAEAGFLSNSCRTTSSMTRVTA